MFPDERFELLEHVDPGGRSSGPESRGLGHGEGRRPRVQAAVGQHQVAPGVAPRVDLRVGLAGPGERGKRGDEA
jgi:hypothetical protein